MSRAHNNIKRSEVSTVPFLTKYSSSFASNSLSDRGVTINRGINTDYDTDGIKFLNYAMIKQMFYQEYITGSLLHSASYWNPNIQSTAASGTLDDDYRYFPTGSGDKIAVVAIPRTVFGEQIARKSVSFKSATYNLIDDGNGNIVDAMNSYEHVGNVLYSQGIAVITNQDYQYALIPADCTISGTALRYTPDNPFIGSGCITGSIYAMTPGNPPTSELLTREQLALLSPIISDFRTGNFAVPNTYYSVGFPGYPDLTAWFQIKYDGYISIPDTGTFNFRMCSDDGSIFRLYDLSDNLVYTLDHDGQHGYTCKNSNVSLTSGVYKFEMDYYQGPPTYLGLTLYWTRPGQSEQIIPAANFICYTPATTTTSTTTSTTTVDYITSEDNLRYVAAVNDCEAISFTAEVTASTGGKIRYCVESMDKVPCGTFSSTDTGPSGCGTNYGAPVGDPISTSLGIYNTATRNYRVGDKLTFIVTEAFGDPTQTETVENISASISIIKYKTYSNGATVPGSEVDVAYYEGIDPTNIISASYIITSQDFATGSYLKFRGEAQATYNYDVQISVEEEGPEDSPSTGTDINLTYRSGSGNWTTVNIGTSTKVYSLKDVIAFKKAGTVIDLYFTRVSDGVGIQFAPSFGVDTYCSTDGTSGYLSYTLTEGTPSQNYLFLTLNTTGATSFNAGSLITC